jgi:S-adenosylmethionine:tRNA-ribosyltransferase-isomerase (queuine synthetase)
MHLSDFQFELPQELIPQVPLPQRDASRMLILDREKLAWEDSAFQRFPELLRGDELIVVNNARVIPARLFGRRAGVRSEMAGRNRRTAREFLSSEIEVLLTKQVAPQEWEALVRPGRKIRVGERIEFGQGELSAEVISRGDFGTSRKRLNVLATSLYRPTFRAKTNQRIANDTRQYLPTARERLRPPQPASIFLQKFSNDCASGASKSPP